MAVTVKQVSRPEVESNVLERTYLLYIVKGLIVTAKNAIYNLIHFKKMAVIQYPEERRAYGPIHRGKHVLLKRDDGTPKCVACMMCATACPADAIEIIAEESPDPAIEKRPKEFVIDGLRCIMCGYCIDACPKEAIEMTDQYEMAEYDRLKLVWTMKDLMERDELLKAGPGYRAVY